MKFLVLTILCIHHVANNLVVLIDGMVFDKSSGRRLPYAFETLKAASAIHCCATCHLTSDCQSVNFQNSTGSCELVPLPLAAVSTHAQPDPDWMVYSGNEWMLAFKGCSDNGDDVYTAYISGLNAVTNDVNCIHGNVTTCSQSNKHFRSPVLDSWDNEEISQVKYVMYKNDNEVAYAIFNGSGSNFTNWFSRSRLLETTWTGIWTPFLRYFSLEGHAPSRRFFITGNYSGCPGDLIFSAAITSKGFGCAYDDQPSFPTYLYATVASGGYPESMTDMDLADYIAVYINR